MADKVNPSFDVLPAELVHRILNFLDDFNIFYTMRNVCQHLDTIVDGYRRYQVNTHVLKSKDPLANLALGHRRESEFVPSSSLPSGMYVL